MAGVKVTFITSILNNLISLLTSFSCWMKLFQALPGVAITAFSLYFAWRKMGNKIDASYAFGAGSLTARQITNVTLINRKDKPVSIFEIYAILGGKVIAPIDKFSPPKILKPLESIHIETTPFSAYVMGKRKYDADFSPKNVQLFVVSQRGKIKCKVDNTPYFALIPKRNGLPLLNINTTTFNGKVYNEKAKFAITYRMDGLKTAFVTKTGLIIGDWDFMINHLRLDQIESPKTVRAALKDIGLDKLAVPYDVDELDQPKYENGDSQE